jgi:hypothetical protein
MEPPGHSGYRYPVESQGRLADVTQPLPLPSAQDGCLLLADITGYTSYLAGSELEHAQDVLADLLETIIAGIEPPFELSKLEGDAAFAYVPTSVVSAPMLMDTIESTYFAFRRRLRDVRNATTCDCDACVLIPSLDLKFFVHQGRYVIRRIARSEELTGSDVVLVHRLLKGTAGLSVNGDAFAVYTKATLDAMEADPSVLGLTPHTETFDDIGDVDVFVENLERRWVHEQEMERRFLTAESAQQELSGDLSAAPPEVWEWFTDPRRRLLWQDGLTSLSEEVDGRRGTGTINHCAHGVQLFTQRVVDWQPFTTFTTVDQIEGTPISLTATTTFEAVEGGTRVTGRWRADPPEAWPTVAEDLIPGMVASVEKLEKILTGELALG